MIGKYLCLALLGVVLVQLAAVCSISLYIFTFIEFHGRKHTTSKNARSFVTLAAGTGMIIIAFLAARGYAKPGKNATYSEFMRSLGDDVYDKRLPAARKFDAEFNTRPVDWEHKNPHPQIKSAKFDQTLAKAGVQPLFRKTVGYVIAHTIGVKVLYPGSSIVYNQVIKSDLLAGRIILARGGGERFKLRASNRKIIDAMFVDRRNRTRNGDILVITCEGNSGFYEHGIATAPLARGYSTLGWNHPGFGESTGRPFPSQEHAAIDCVINFAIDRLNFTIDRVILYGWSIGGYAATWGAVRYPKIKSLVLDATFDDILPVALAVTPQSLKPIVRLAIKGYLDLNIVELLRKYGGSVLLIRRTEDKRMCIPSREIVDNRANILLSALLRGRYPYLFVDSPKSFEALNEYLAQPQDKEDPNAEAIDIDCSEELKNYREKMRKDDQPRYPSRLGIHLSTEKKSNLVKCLARKYMKDQAGGHNKDLSPHLFQPGWDLES